MAWKEFTKNGQAVSLVILVSATMSFMTALVGFAVVWREVRVVHTSVNSRMDELLEITRRLTRAETRAEMSAEDAAKSADEVRETIKRHKE